jgi:pimeloyl-ACP methyl ester carboxylesterase
MDGIKGELVSFPTQDGLILHGFLAKPKARSDKAILNVHGLHGNFYKSKYANAISQTAVRNGFCFLSIEQRGSYAAFGMGQKKGKKFKRLLGGGSYEKFEDSAYDIDGAVRFLKRIGIKKIFLQGHSTGCQKITYYQYKKQNSAVKAIILLGPVDDYNLRKTELGRKFGEAVKFARKNIKNKDMLMPKKYINGMFSVSRFLSFADLKYVESRIFNYELPRLKEFGSIRQPILAVFGSKEQYACKPVDKYMRILAANSKSKRFTSLIIRNADHGFRNKEKELATKLIDYLKGV